MFAESINTQQNAYEALVILLDTIFCLICCFEMALNLMSGLHCKKCDLRVKLVLFCQGFKSFSSNKNIQMNTKLNKVWPLAIIFA